MTNQRSIVKSNRAALRALGLDHIPNVLSVDVHLRTDRMPEADVTLRPTPRTTERQLIALVAVPELLDALQAVVTELDEGDGNAPGHGHTTPGVWDDDNGTLSGTACTWCAQWSQAKAAIAKATGAQP